MSPELSPAKIVFHRMPADLRVAIDFSGRLTEAGVGTVGLIISKIILIVHSRGLFWMPQTFVMATL